MCLWILCKTFLFWRVFQVPLCKTLVSHLSLFPFSLKIINLFFFIILLLFNPLFLKKNPRSFSFNLHLFFFSSLALKKTSRILTIYLLQMIIIISSILQLHLHTMIFIVISYQSHHKKYIKLRLKKLIGMQKILMLKITCQKIIDHLSQTSTTDILNLGNNIMLLLSSVDHEKT